MTEFYAHTIPSGLLDKNIEFMVNHGELVFTQFGQIHPFKELSIEAFEILQNILSNDAKAQKGLDILGITDPCDRIHQFAFCRFGGLDAVADIDMETEKVNFEYWDCGSRPCPADGLLCRLPEVPNGKLTIHESSIMRKIAGDSLNKEIADQLHISCETVNKECQTIVKKLGCFTKNGIAAFAAKNNIL